MIINIFVVVDLIFVFVETNNKKFKKNMLI
jgi:hypothetical protein